MTLLYTAGAVKYYIFRCQIHHRITVAQIFIFLINVKQHIFTSISYSRFFFYEMPVKPCAYFSIV